MKIHVIPSINLGAGAVVALAFWTAVPATAFQSSTTSAAATKNAIEEHLDEADDLLETLLDWRRAIVATPVGGDSRTPPTEPLPTHTLIPLDRQQVEKLTQLITAITTMVPGPTASDAPRGDMRAHVEKAGEIAAELLPGSTRAVGTSGSTATANIVMVDRAALQRLDIEVDAMEMLVRASRARG